MTEAQIKTYAKSVVFLHWVMALSFIVMLISGFVMTYMDLDKSLQFKLYQWHKSGGVLLLIAAFLRVAVRVRTKNPSLPESIKGLEKIAAKLGHMGLYALMFLMPLSGWIMVSSSIYGLPTVVFGWFEWPHLPNMQGDEAINKASKTAHFILALLFVGLIAAHIAAVIKHYIIDKENLLRRMAWSFKKDS